MDFFDINNIAFTVFDYPMSWIELIGTVFGILSVYLVVRRNILNYPFGLVSVGLFIFLFWQIGLYADGIEQIVFFVMSIFGWYQWSRGRKADDEKVEIYRLPLKTTLIWFVGIAIASFLFGMWLTTAHITVPTLFPEPASFPFVDAATTVFSFVAMFWMNRRIMESWIIWVAIDIVGIVLYWQKDVRLVSLLYVVYLVLATSGMFSWIGKLRNQSNS